jgi:pimeloyl-ACP methyl ester carboxylesterase
MAATMLTLTAGRPTVLAAQNYDQFMNGLDMLSATMSMMAYGVTTSEIKGSSSQCTVNTALRIQEELHKKFAISSGTMWTRVIEQVNDSVLAIVYAHKNLVVVAFRGSCGTDPDSRNWRMNYNGASNVDEKGFNALATHRGWARATNVMVNSEKSFYEEVAQWTRVALETQGGGKYLLITGHSMGGAMAHYFAYRFLDANGPWVPKAFNAPSGKRYVRTRILTFGAPKGGYGACGSNAASLEVGYKNLLADRTAWAASFEITGDPILNLTEKSGVCPRTMGDRIVGGNSFGSDVHDVRNYALIIARNVQSAYGQLPYRDMYDPFGSWNSPIVP